MKIISFIFICLLYPIICYSGQWSLVYEHDTTSSSFLTTRILCADSINCVSFGNISDLYPCNRVTTDGGKTWKITLEDSKIIWKDSSDGKKYAVHTPSRFCAAAYPDTNLCIALCRNYLWRSIDKCQTWKKMIVDSIAFYRIHFFNNKFGVIKSSSANPPYIFVTHDGGLSWGKKYYYNPNDTLLPPQYFYDVFCPEMNVIKVTANNDSTETFIISSSDGGNTWERGEEPPRGVYRIFFINRYIGWSCGTQKVNTGWYKEKIYKTEDGGMTWNVQVDTLLDKKNMALVNIVFADENYGLAVGLWSRLWHTTNGGKNWFTLEEPSENNFFYDVAYPAKDMVYGACYAYNQIWKYTGYFTGVAEIPAIQNINITLYPNPLPSGEPLKMKILLDFPHEAEISIYNYLGQLMDTPRRQFLNAGEATLQYSDYGYFPLGAYCLVIKIGSRAFSKSFVVY